jgi:hypothetical protein
VLVHAEQPPRAQEQAQASPNLLWLMIPIHEGADSRRTLPTFPGHKDTFCVNSTKYGGGTGPANNPVAQHSRPAPADAMSPPCVGGRPGLTFRCGATNSGAASPTSAGRWLHQTGAVTGRLD